MKTKQAEKKVTQIIRRAGAALGQNKALEKENRKMRRRLEVSKKAAKELQDNLAQLAARGEKFSGSLDTLAGCIDLMKGLTASLISKTAPKAPAKLKVAKAS